MDFNTAAIATFIFHKPEALAVSQHALRAL